MAIKVVIPRLPIRIGVPGVASIPMGDITPIGPPQPPTPEADAWEHWFLSGSDASLTGLVNGRALTPQADGRVWTPDGVYIPNRTKALVSGFADAEVQTVWAVIKRYDIATFLSAVVHFGAGSHTTDGGSSFGTSSSASPNDMVGTIRNGVASRTVTWPSGILAGDWAFVALSEQYDGSNRNYCVYIGGASSGSNAVISGVTDKTLAARNIALGSAYHTTAATGDNIGVTAREFGIKAAFLNRDQLDALYAGSKENHLRSGIQVR